MSDWRLLAFAGVAAFGAAMLMAAYAADPKADANPEPVLAAPKTTDRTPLRCVFDWQILTRRRCTSCPAPAGGGCMKRASAAIVAVLLIATTAFIKLNWYDKLPAVGTAEAA